MWVRGFAGSRGSEALGVEGALGVQGLQWFRGVGVQGLGGS